MNFHISGYNQSFIIAIVACSLDVANELIQNKYVVAFINENKICFLPSGYEVGLTDIEKQKLEGLNDYDIIEINDRGIGYRLYARNEGDTTVVITPKCNSNCIMCPASERERRNSGGYLLSNIEQFIEYLPSDLYNLVITGGEPTLGKDDFLKISNTIKSKFQYTKVLLLTNGRSMSIESFFKNFLEVAPKHLRVAIPLHGHFAELHDKITQTANSFNQTIIGINNLLKAKVEVEIRVVVNKINADYLTDISEFIINSFHNVHCVNFVGLEVRGNCVKNAKDVFIDYGEATKKSASAIDRLVNAGIDVGLYNYPLCLLDEKYWPIAAKSIAPYKSKYYAKCNLCDVKDSCCGIFQASLAFIKPEVYPIKKKG